ncbi:gram-negative porin family protein, partial [Vibrio parahaemolyticus EKP-028]
GAASRIQLHT